MKDKSKLGVMIERVQLNKNPIDLVYSHIRYEYLRTIDPKQFHDLWMDCLSDKKKFDTEVLRRAINES
jgi:hypothetical protein